MLKLDDNRIAHTRIRTPLGPLSAFIKEDVEPVEFVFTAPTETTIGFELKWSVK